MTPAHCVCCAAPQTACTGEGASGTTAQCMPALLDASCPKLQTPTRPIAVGQQPICGQFKLLGIIGVAISSALRRCMCCEALQATCTGGGTVFEACCAMRQTHCAGALLLQQVGCDLLSGVPFAC